MTIMSEYILCKRFYPDSPREAVVTEVLSDVVSAITDIDPDKFYIPSLVDLAKGEQIVLVAETEDNHFVEIRFEADDYDPRKSSRNSTSYLVYARTQTEAYAGLLEAEQWQMLQAA
jgi:hypothetical protein